MSERQSASEEDSVVGELPGTSSKPDLNKSPSGKRAAGSMYIQPTNRTMEARNSQGDAPKMASARSKSVVVQGNHGDAAEHRAGVARRES